MRSTVARRVRLLVLLVCLTGLGVGLFGSGTVAFDDISSTQVLRSHTLPTWTEPGPLSLSQTLSIRSPRHPVPKSSLTERIHNATLSRTGLVLLVAVGLTYAVRSIRNDRSYSAEST